MATNYLFPGAGTVPATGAQAYYASRQVATVDLLTTDTTFTFTHEWAFDTQALARLCPHVVSAIPVGAARGAISVASRSTNAVVFDATVTVAGVFEIVLDRPHSIIMPNT